MNVRPVTKSYTYVWMCPIFPHFYHHFVCSLLHVRTYTYSCMIIFCIYQIHVLTSTWKNYEFRYRNYHARIPQTLASLNILELLFNCSSDRYTDLYETDIHSAHIPAMNERDLSEYNTICVTRDCARYEWEIYVHITQYV